MLFLTRKPGEEIVFNNDIRLLVVSAPGGFVRLGIDSPDVLVSRTRLTTLPDDPYTPGDSADDTVELFPRQPNTEQATAIVNVVMATADEAAR